MIILDTDHISILQRSEENRAQSLRRQLKDTGEDIRTTIVTYEEQMRAWLSLIAQQRNTLRQVEHYNSLIRFSAFYRSWNLLEFDADAATEFERLRKARVRISTMDLKIGAIAVTRNSLLLSSNLRHFEQIPNLRVEDWVH